VITNETIITYRFSKNYVESCLRRIAKYSCVRDRNDTVFHKGAMKQSGSISSNLMAPLIGTLGEMVVRTYIFGFNNYKFSYSRDGDGGYDLITPEGVKIDVKTTKSKEVAGYIISERSTGSRVNLLECDEYWFVRCCGWEGDYPVEFTLSGHLSSKEVNRLPDIKSPVASHYNKVVPLNLLRTRF
jgi:hypothetical protein